MSPLVTIVTATYNRPEMFAECTAAVRAQTFTDWTWWVVFNKTCWPVSYDEHLDPIWDDSRFVPIWFPITEDVRSQRHVPAMIVNWLYPKVTTPYIYWLSDDDLIDPDGMKALVNVSYGYHTDAVYGCCEVVDQQPDGYYKQACWCYPGDPISTPAGEGWDVGADTGIEPKCLLDGGQVLHTKALWDRATADGWRLTDSKADAGANDGTLLNRLAQFARFHFVPTKIVTHRRHRGATFHKPQ